MEENYIINAKIEGINYQLAKESKIGHLKKRTMIVGLNVTQTY